MVINYILVSKLGINYKESEVHMKKKIIIFIMLFLIIVAVSSFGEIVPLNNKKILILHSYSMDFVWTENLHYGIIDELQEYEQLDYRIEYMDTKNYYSQTHLDDLYQLYKDKYHDEQFDLIIATDNNALLFLQAYRDELFGKIPVVSAGINNIELISELPSLFYVIEEKPDYAKTIELAIEQGENTKTMYFILDNTPTSISVRHELEEVLRAYRKDYNIVFISDPEKEETQLFIEHLGEDDLIFWVLFFRDMEGISYSYDELLEPLARRSGRPVYVFWDFYLDKEVIGGHVLDSVAYSEAIVSLASQVINNDNGRVFIYDDGRYGKSIIDYQVAERYKMTHFSRGVELINQPSSYIEQNKELLLAFAGVIIVMSTIIVLLLRVIRSKNELHEKNNEIHALSEGIIETQSHLISTLGDLIETKSDGTANHVLRVSKISGFLAQKLNFTEEEVKILELISPMHDVGKIGISENILQKPARLTAEEYDVIKTHTTIGYELLKDSHDSMLNLASLVAYQHHERWDGTGYPKQLSGIKIHPYARITSVADVYDALRSRRPYKDSWSKSEVVAYFEEESGKMFDPSIVDKLLLYIEEIEKIRVTYSDETSRSKTLLGQ